VDRPSDQGWAGCRGRAVVGGLSWARASDPCSIRFVAPALSNGLCLSRPPGGRGGVSESPVAARKHEARRSKRLWQKMFFDLASSNLSSAIQPGQKHSDDPSRQGFASDGGEAASTVGCQPPHTLCAARVNPSLRVPGPSGCAFLRSRSLNACMQHRSRGSIVPCLSPNPAVMPPAFVWLGGRRASHQVT